MAPGSLTRMGRPPAYTDEEDAIILANRSYDDVIREFKDRGFDTNRHASTIAARRRYLKTKGQVPIGTGQSEHALITLVARRDELTKKRDRLNAELEGVVRELYAINQQVHAAANAVKEETPLDV